MTTTIRAGIMLAVLVGLPAAWIYYGPLPPAAQRIADRLVADAKGSLGVEAAAAEKVAETAAAPPALDVPVQAPMQVKTQSASPTAQPAAIDPPPPSGLEQQVAPLLVRLQQLGAASYRLEPWGATQSVYRFWCEMPLADGGATEEFEAIRADPRAAIEQVVGDVVSWQADASSGRAFTAGR